MNDLFLIEVKMKPQSDYDQPCRKLLPITLKNNITVITGENGCGKSTLIEAIAIGLGCNVEGGGRNFNFTTVATHSELHKHIRLSKGHKKERDVFFYRAETFYNFNSEMRRLDCDASFDPEIKTYYGGNDLHSLSHGEAMEALYQNRFKPGGLYLLDEPEASLSPLRQLGFILRIAELADQGAQFIIVTHSPLIMLIPGCDLRRIEGDQIRHILAEESETISIYKAVINSDGRYLSQMILESD